ncbi:hypothetical protein K1719_034165 [Acacia pycnantha]|nr:hypothetical protein K1719_034165 [Acacia pycnantha]
MIEVGLVTGVNKLSNTTVASGLTHRHHHHLRRVGGVAQARTRIVSIVRFCRLDFGKHDLTGLKSSHFESILRFS